MPRALVTSTTVPLTGSDPTLTAANIDGDAVELGGRLFLLVNNGSASPITVTIETPGTVDGLAVADQSVTVPAAAKRFIPLSATSYRQPAGTTFAGYAHVNYSSVTTVTRAVVRLA